MERLAINMADVENLNDMVNETNKALGEISRRLDIAKDDRTKMNKKLSNLEEKMDKIMKHFGIE